MPKTLQQLKEEILKGGRPDRATALELAAGPDKEALFQAADEIRREKMGNRFHLCSIINAKSGNCTENCRFCAQSARHHTGIDTYTLIEPEEAMTIARDNDEHQVHRLSLVTSGRNLSQETVNQLASLYQDIAAATSMLFCASAGLLDEEVAASLVKTGVSRYHCNLEANRDFFPQVCTTHTWEEKVATLKIAREAGMSLCSGGIIGMGESMEDRIALALELRELGITSIPMNLLTPIPGTPLAELEPLSSEEVLTVIALFRLINPTAVIRMAGGRQQLGADQYRCFAAGANGAIVGNYLTTTGSSLGEDLEQLAAMGFTFERDAGDE
ncbi:biotin synthase BioB [Desulfogranum mediterraneum]|uniref:biotin synthase BioB n=1 Tax=Desulfogranum mediterraneum TaxID=160661 RepID=UPI0003FC8106|nr:biotin synthase BioB [Desulfogranum mediterraneum]